MDFLLDNFLVSMDAYAFLALYVLFLVLLVLGLLTIRSNADQSDRLSVPPVPPEPDPHEIAYLRGGVNEAARSVVFALVQKGLVDISTRGEVSRLVKPNPPVTLAGLGAPEQIVMDWLGMGREASEVFRRGSGLTERLQPYLSYYQLKLEGLSLLTSQEELSRMRKYAFAAAGLFAMIGGYRAASSIVYGHFNIVFTVVFAIIGATILVSMGRRRRLTKLGKLYLGRLQFVFQDLKLKSQEPYIRTPETRLIQQPSFSGVDPLLLSVGVFGSGILAGTVFDDYNSAFGRSQNYAAGCGSGAACGSGCSSGSDGGGGSCGGGCGGGGCGG